MDINIEEISTLDGDHSPFDLTNSNFNNKWWVEAYSAEENTRGRACFLLISGDEEIGRVELQNTKIPNRFIGIDEEKHCREITFIEISKIFRNQGFGCIFLQLLIDEYPDMPLVAFSNIEAERFWEKAGWNYYEHVGKNQRIKKLFASEIL